MVSAKPQISVLMAVFEPRMDWLKEQLASLNAQTYPNLKLYIRDDCSRTVPFEDIKNLAGQCITKFPFVICRNEENLGSNETFECLTREAEGTYFAFCDQDDVWHPRKLEVLQRAIEAEKAALACSDVAVIDEHGTKIAETITRVWPHHVFLEGPNLAGSLLVKNFALGCATLIRSEIAKTALPFCPYMVHDHYLALCAAVKGSIVTLPEPLISHRIHSVNQTAVLAGVTDRKSYYRIRLEELEHRMNWLQNRFSDDRELIREIQNAKTWITAREKWFTGDLSQGGTVWKYRRYSKGDSLFELTVARMPEPLFRHAVKLVQKGIL